MDLRSFPTLRPLNQLLKKGCDKNFGEPTGEQNRAFTLLQDALVKAPILKMPNPNRDYSVDTKACNHQIGAALFQEYDKVCASHQVLVAQPATSRAKLQRY